MQLQISVTGCFAPITIQWRYQRTESTEIELQLKSSPDSAVMFNVGISPVNHAVPQGHLYVLGPCAAGVPSGHVLIEKFNKVFTIKGPNDFLFLFL